MSSKHTLRKCRCCKTLFTPDRHNPGRQLFCSAPVCRRASKAASQRRWLSKPDNRKYFRDEKNVERVQEWRKAHPGYWKRTKTRLKSSQDADSQPVSEKRDLVTQFSRDLEPLQDLVLTEHPAFVGLISLVTGSTLQEDIATVTRNLLRQGQNILGLSSGKNPQAYDSKTTPPTRPDPSGATEFQLGGSSTGSG